jgi:hexosaminidase
MPLPLLLPMPRKITFQDGIAYTDSQTVLYVEDKNLPAQGYKMMLLPEFTRIHIADKPAQYYAQHTLSQLIEQYPDGIPAMVIEDYPDFERRGVMLDVSRDRVPTMKTLYALIDKLASWKINELQLYMEHTFAYEQHAEVWRDASPFTAQEIRELVEYCQFHHIDVVPNQNSLGHMERWLKHPRYNGLAETPEGFLSPWHNDGTMHEPTTLNPLDPQSMALIKGLYDELLPNFKSDFFNVGLDEPWELGKGASKAEWDKVGGRVYLDWIKQLHQHVSEHGRTMQFWADIIVKYPDLVAELPKDAVAMIWGYEANEPNEGDVELVSGSGLAFYVVPGTSTWNSLAGRTDNALGNLRTASRLGRKYGGKGFLNTEWGDNGHWQPLSASYLAFAYGAGVAWCHDSNADMDIPALLDQFAFGDSAGVMGRIAYELGNVYQLLPMQIHNGSLLYHVLQMSDDQLRQRFEKMVTDEQFATLQPVLAHILERIQVILAPLDSATMKYDDAQTKAEYRQIGRLFTLAIRRLQSLMDEHVTIDTDEWQEAIAEQRRLWLGRFREGGLADSVGRFLGKV